jgi:hypothetical protein
MLLAHLYTESGDLVDVVTVPPFLSGYPPILAWDGRFFQQDQDRDSDLYHEVHGHVVHARPLRIDRPSYDDKQAAAVLLSWRCCRRTVYTTRPAAGCPQCHV